MILAVNPNTAVDRTLFIPSFKPGSTIRATAHAIGMGGKASDAAWILAELGYPCRLLGFAAGEAGQLMERMLRARGVDVAFTPVLGETRVNTVIVCEASGEQSTISIDTLEVQPAHAAGLCAAVEESLPDCGCLVLGGSLPNGVDTRLYGNWTARARVLGIPVLVDTSGEPLRQALEAGPTMIKPNREELSMLLGREISGTADAYEAGREILAEYGAGAVITLGAEGALAVLPEQAWYIPPLQVPVCSTAGAGDGVLAGLAAAYDSGGSVEEGLRLGFAAAAAVMQTPATADCCREVVESLLPKIRLEAFP